MSEEKPTIFARNRKRREAKLKPLGDVRLPDETKDLIIEAVAEGAMITELVERNVLPSYHHLWNECKRDTIFDAEYKAAQAKGARLLMNAANEHAQEMLESGDVDQMRCAESFMRVTETFVEKIAPKEFGQLVKLGSDPDAPLAVQVINYALPAVVPLQVIDTEARAIPTNEATPRARGETLGGNEESQTDTASAGA